MGVGLSYPLMRARFRPRHDYTTEHWKPWTAWAGDSHNSKDGLVNEHGIPEWVAKENSMRTTTARKFAAIWGAALLGTAGSSTALSQEFDLVIVDMKAIARDVAQNIHAEPSTMPLTVQAPMSVAADVCGIAVEVLRSGAGQSGAAGCVAVTSSRALEELVREKIGQ